MLHRVLLIALLVVAVLALTPNGAAQQSEDDFFEMQENLAQSFPVLRNDDAGAGGAHLDLAGTTVASDASGPLIITINGIDFYAFRNVDDMQGSGLAHGGWSSLAGVDPSRIGYTGDDMELLGVTGTADVAYEVYAEVDGSFVPYHITLDGNAIGTGSLDVVTVVIDRNESSPTFGLATGYGQITLEGPSGAAFYEEAVVKSCGRGVLYFELERFVPTRFSDPDVIETSGYVQPVGFEVVSVTQAQHGTVTASPDGLEVRYQPDFGFDGTDSFTYTARHCATNTTSTATVTVFVEGENDAPVAGFVGPQLVQEGDSAQFFDTSTDVDGTIAARDWSVDGVGGISGAAPTIAWPTPGSHTLCLAVTDDDGATDTACQTILVNARPTASFAAPAPLFTGESGAFHDLSDDSDGIIVAWAWDFGDGNTSTAQHPSHAWATEGWKTVCLNVTDDDGGTAGACGGVQVMNRAPVADAVATPALARVSRDVAFHDLSSDADGAVVAWAWDFGDGATSAAQHPTHAYAAAGAYDVTLVVTDDSGATGTTTLVVEVLPVRMAGRAQTLVGPVDASRLGDTGPVDTTTPTRERRAASVDTNEATVTAADLEVAAADGAVVSTAKAAAIDVRAAGVRVELIGATATASATCDGAVGEVRYKELRVNGNLVDGEATAGPNEAYGVPGVLLVTLNAQRLDADGNLVVSALRIETASGVVDALVATAGVHECDHPEPAAPEARQAARQDPLLALLRRLVP